VAKSIPSLYFLEERQMIKLFTDHYFHIGGAHLTSGKPCQDYAISDVYEDMAFAIISDGCSTGRNTDVGSRVLSLSTASAMRDNWLTRQMINSDRTPSEISMRQHIVLSGIQESLDLISDDMLATCAYAYVSPAGGFIHVQGDGVVALKYDDGRVIVHNFEWSNNMPYYPAYKNGKLKQFIDAHGGDVDEICLQKETWIIDDESAVEQEVYQYSLSQGVQGVTINISQTDLRGVKFIAVFSDGVTQIDGVDWKDAVKSFLAFKNTTGAFAKRRMIRGIKDMQKIGKGPVDDISYAVIRVDATKQEDKNNGKDNK